MTIVNAGMAAAWLGWPSVLHAAGHAQMDLFLLLIAAVLAMAGTVLFVAGTLRRGKESGIWAELVLACVALMVAGAALAGSLDLAALRRGVPGAETVQAGLGGNS